MERRDARELIEKYTSGKCSPEERAIVENWYIEAARHATDDHLAAPDFNKAETRLNKTLPVYQQKTINLYYRYAAAVVVLMTLSFGAYFILRRPAPVQVALLKPGTFKNDVLPGDKVILTLSNGRKIDVNDVHSGNVTNQDGVDIQKTANGHIIYQSARSGNENTEVAYNTFTTLRGGGKHTLQLADGTMAILDAGSSIRFPVAFSGPERRVEVSGQVYFEVVHNAAKPFRVLIDGLTIEDIGTHFNINGFDKKSGIKTTLLEGSVKVYTRSSLESGKRVLTLKPGQQAVQINGNKIGLVSNVDVEGVMAWKNDMFKFSNNTPLTMVMDELSRWYDLDVIYKGVGKTYHFGGYVSRNSKLLDVLKILQYSGVQFAVDGNKIVVYQ